MARHDPHHENEVTPGMILIMLVLLVLLWFIIKFLVWLSRSLILLLRSILLHPAFWFIVSMLLFVSPAPNVAGAFCLFITVLSSYWQSGRVTIRDASWWEFEQVKNLFIHRWRKGSCGTLKRVLLIDNPILKKRFQTYLAGLSKATVSQYYHGTKLKCDIYHSLSFCGYSRCGVCGISQQGFLMEYKSSNIPYFQRFGDGFYLAPNSSKCHDYTQGHGNYRAMLLFDVAQGKKFVVKRNNTGLTAPPSGYDSVYGRRGQSLNYDEIVIYDPDAALPTHILIYEKDGIHKIA